MAINFPGSPSVNQIFSDPTSGFTYQWNGTVWVNYNYTAPAKIQELDDISGSFDGLTQTFALTVSSSAVSPVKPDQLTINIGGILQNPGVDYTISGSDITFTTAPDAGLDFYGVLLGGSTNLTEAATGSVGPTAFTSGGPSWNTSGDLLVTGVTTIANTGTASTALTVLGGARITGILTVGSSSITIDGANNEITVGTGVTLSTSGINVGIITGVFYGDGSGLDNVGVGTTGSVNTSGIVTASSFYGDGSGLVNLGGPLSVLTYQPSIGSTNVGLTTNIVLTFNKPIVASAGTITLRTDSASGTIIESYDVTSSSNLSISGGTLTIDPTSSLSGLTTYFVVLPAGVYKDDFESSSSAVVDTYSFTTQQLNYELWAWGYNAYGELGQNDVTQYSSPIQVPGTQWTSIAGPYTNTLATKDDGTLWAWGRNLYGESGQNTQGISYSSPTQVPGTQWNKIASTSYTNLATKTDGTLWAWGRNRYGEVGNGTAGVGGDNSHYSSPVQIPGTQWNDISGGRLFSAATKTDGTLWVWADNSYGELGQNNTVQYSSPVQVPGTQWDKFAPGYDSIWTIKTDGTFWSWGRNQSGQLGGTNDTLPRSSPIQVPGTQWNNLSNTSRTYSFIATKTDGTLWGGGYAGSGRLGLNSQIEYSSPIQIPGTQWSSVSLGYASGMGTKTDNTLWTWGNNGDGQLGHNNTINRSSPVQVPGTQWYSIRSNYIQSVAIKQT